MPENYPHHVAETTLQRYYDAFNRKDVKTFVGLLTDDVVHEINQGGIEKGKEPFRKFMEKMNKCYDEKVEELVIFVNEKGDHAASEFFIRGKYIATDAGLPPARGQNYYIRCGTFFELKEGKISRVTTYYNLKEWLEKVK
jgi:steroid delta-isomerase-like uncharacterized protein